jgi:hypothetical protein
MRTILAILALGAIALIVAAEPNVTGKWSGTFHSTSPEGEARESTALLILQQTGAEITGSFGPSESEQMPVSKGKIEGDKVTPSAASEGRTVTFDLVLTGDRLKGDVNMAHGDQVAKAKIDVTRSK